MNFTEILNFESSDVSAPKPLPGGSYATIVKSYELTKMGQSQTKALQFTLQVQGPLDDVDEQELKDFGSVNGRLITATIWLNDETEEELKNTRWKITKFLDACKVDDGSPEARLEACINCQVGAFVKHKTNDDGRVFAQFVRAVEL